MFRAIQYLVTHAARYIKATSRLVKEIESCITTFETRSGEITMFASRREPNGDWQFPIQMSCFNIASLFDLVL